MRPHVKITLVVAGYAIAVAVAAAAVACHLIALGGPNNGAYSGMNAFGDSLLFLAIFGIAAMPPTAAAFFWLRSYPLFWRGFSVLALVFAVTSLAALVAVTSGSHSMMAGLAFLRILVAPLITLIFGLSVFLAPSRAFRLALLIATVIEVTGFAGWVITCFVRNY